METVIRAQIESLKEQLEQDSTNEYLWYQLGREHLELKEYDQAIRLFSKGIARAPRCARLLHERAHRYINVGEHEKAAADFAKAAQMRPRDENVFYHYGLSHYLLGEYHKAERIYRHCLTLCDSDSDITSTSNWLWATLVHRGKMEEAQAVLDSIQEDMDTSNDSSTGYYRLLLLYKQILKPEDVIPDPEKPIGLLEVTGAYGVSNYYYYVEGDVEKADAMLDNIIATVPQEWRSAFGYQAALTERNRR